MTDYSTITDGTTTLQFIGNPDFKPFTHAIGAAWNPLGYGLTTMSLSAIVRGITLTMIIIDDSTDEPSLASDMAFWEMLMEGVALTITWPDGVTTMTVMPDPQTDPISTAQYSLFEWFYMNTWTVKFFEVDE